MFFPLLHSCLRKEGRKEGRDRGKKRGNEQGGQEKKKEGNGREKTGGRIS